MLGDWRTLLDLDDRYEAITAEEMQRVAKAVFAPHRRNVIELVPGEQLEADPEDLAQAVDAHLLVGGAL
jgi:predicted Zn-dependent peptidase